MTNKDSFLTKDDTTYLKAIAILFIVFHNFLHLLPPVYFNNEFTFRLGYVFIAIGNFSLEESINVFFSFFGYIGIYVFFFLSGYGLTKKQIVCEDKWYSIKRIWKLEKLLIIGILVYILTKLGDVNYSHVLSKLTLTDNFSLAKVRRISASWWFLACTAQLYLIYFPLYKYIRKSSWNILFVLYFYTILSYFWIFSPYREEYMYRNCLGHIPEFSLGIFLACYEDKLAFLKRKGWVVFLISIVVLLMAQFSMWIWIFNGLATVGVFIGAYLIFGKIIQNKFIKYIGTISSYIYITHCILFRQFFVVVARYASPLEKIIWCLVWLLIVITICTIIYILNQKQKSIKFLKNNKSNSN